MYNEFERMNMYEYVDGEFKEIRILFMIQVSDFTTKRRLQ